MNPQTKITKKPEYSKQAAKYINGFDTPSKQRVMDDVATPADFAAIADSQADYEQGETVSHDDINWD